MIQLDRVTKYFDTNIGRKYILKNVSITIPENLSVGVLGRNGAGKSTFLRMLGGVDFPNSGRIISDKRFSWRLGLASGFQGSLSGRDNAIVNGLLLGFRRKQVEQKLDQIIAFSELEAFIDYAKVDDYRGFGGVRIEDNVLVLDDGQRVLGKPIAKSIEEVEALYTAP